MVKRRAVTKKVPKGELLNEEYFAAQQFQRTGRMPRVKKREGTGRTVDMYGTVRYSKSLKNKNVRVTKYRKTRFVTNIFKRRDDARKTFVKEKFLSAKPRGRKRRQAYKIQYYIEADTPRGRFTATSNAFLNTERADRETIRAQARDNLLEQLSGEYTDEYSVKRGAAVLTNLKKKGKIRIREGYRIIERV